MIMLCWFYCFSFAMFLYFASAPVTFLFALFALKRGIYHARRGLRQMAFILMFLSGLKMFIFDVRQAKRHLLCSDVDGFMGLNCTVSSGRVLEFGGILALVFFSAALFLLYPRYINMERKDRLTPDDVNLRFWANMTLACVAVMVVWQLAPWVGYLTVGAVPAIFTVISWQMFAILNLGLLLMGFWKAESCNWNRYEKSSQRKIKQDHLHNTWTPKDTLWMTVFVYLTTLALSYVAHDVLTPAQAVY